MAFLPRHGSSRGEVIGLQSVCEEYKAVRVNVARSLISQTSSG
jgi:hypothetical protein